MKAVRRLPTNVKTITFAGIYYTCGEMWEKLLTINSVITSYKCNNTINNGPHGSIILSMGGKSHLWISASRSQPLKQQWKTSGLYGIGWWRSHRLWIVRPGHERPWTWGASRVNMWPLVRWSLAAAFWATCEDFNSVFDTTDLQWTWSTTVNRPKPATGYWFGSYPMCAWVFVSQSKNMNQDQLETLNPGF